MAIKDWPVPVRRAIAIALVAFAVVISFGPITLLLWKGNEIAEMFPTTAAQVFAGYSSAISIGTTVVVAIFAFLNLQKTPRDLVAFYIVVGAMLGLVVGIALIPITAGVAPFLGPPAGMLTFLAGWIIWRLRHPK